MHVCLSFSNAMATSFSQEKTNRHTKKKVKLSTQTCRKRTGNDVSVSVKKRKAEQKMSFTQVAFTTYFL